MKVDPNNRNALIRRLMPALALMTAVPAFAAIAALPPEHEQGAVAFRSGGVGEDEAAAMKQAAARYPLELQFYRKMKDGHDEYLAGDKVSIRDRHGNVMLHTTTDGPFLLARLPAGLYTVSASDDGIAKEHPVDVVPGKHRRVTFEW